MPEPKPSALAPDRVELLRALVYTGLVSQFELYELQQLFPDPQPTRLDRDGGKIRVDSCLSKTGWDRSVTVRFDSYMRGPREALKHWVVVSLDFVAQGKELALEPKFEFQDYMLHGNEPLLKEMGLMIYRFITTGTTQ